MEDKKTQKEIYITGGNIYRLKGDYQKAFDYDFKAYNIIVGQKNNLDKAKILNNLGIDLYRLLSYEKALNYYFEAVAIYNKLGDTSYVGDTYNNIGMVYDDIKVDDSAFFYYNKAIEMFNKTDNKEGVADVLNNIAGTYYRLGDLEKVLEYALKSLSIREETGNRQAVAFTLINIGATYFSMNNYSKAIEYDLKGIQIAKKIGNIPIIRYGCKNISEVYAQIKDFENAYKFHLEYSLANDSIYNADKVRIMNEMQTKYETEKKEQQISLLKSDAAVKELKMQRIKIFWISLLIVSLLILFIAVILYHQNKIKSRTNKLLESKNDKLRILNATKDKFFAIISHDLKNPLSAFCNITGSIDQYFEDINRDQMHNYIKEINKSSNALKDLLMNLLQWSAIQNQRILPILSDVIIKNIIDENIELLKSNIELKKITIYSQIDENEIIIADKDMFSTICRNLISNAIKFTKPNGEIKIFTKKNHKTVDIFFEDNGIGISEQDIDKLFRIDIDTKTIGNSTEKGTGLGLIIVKEMTEICNGNISVKSKKNEGSVFILNLPSK